MKKKVLYGVFMALFAAFSMSSLQSCTDDLTDLKHQYQYDKYNLDQDIANLQQQINDNKAQCESEISRLEGEITTNTGLLQDSIDANAGNIKKLQDDLKALNNEVAARYTNAQIDSLLNELKDKLASYNNYEKGDSALQEQIDANLASLNVAVESLDSLKGVTTKLGEGLAGAISRIDKNEKDIADLVTNLALTNGSLAAMQTKLDSLENVINDMKDTLTSQGADIETIKNEINSMKNDITTLQQQYNNLNKDFQQLLQDIYGTGGLVEQINKIYKSLTDQIAGVQGQVTNVQDQIDQMRQTLETLEDKYDSLLLRLNDLVTGIIIQATDNPIFGNFSLPLGIQSNMLFNWYAVNKHGEDFTFPSASADYAYDGDAVLTAADLQLLNPALYDVKPGYFLDAINLGKLFLTINPVGTNFNNATFSLETSAGKALPYTLNVKPSDEELYFGYSRSLSNGFYESDVMMPATDAAITATEIVIEDGLKTAAKEILNDVSKRNAYNLLKAVYHQVNNTLPAYAVRFDRVNRDRSSYSILSKYDLAVATGKPLSYEFLKGRTINHRLRTFGHISNFILELKESGDLHFDFTNNKINLNGLTISLPQLTITANMEMSEPSIVAIIPSINVYDSKTGELIGKSEEQHATVTGVETMQDDIKKAFDNAISSLKNSVDGWSDQVDAEINGKVNDMLKDVETEINKMMANISGQINDKIDNLIDKYGNKAEPIFKRVNQLIDLYNRVAGKINSFLEDPNAYLQPVIFYRNGARVHILSNVKADPTILNAAGGDAFSIYLSSYTAEIVAPAAKKFVAVTNVYDANTKASVLNAHRSEVQAINSASANFNKVLEGEAIRAAVATSNMKKGLIYEIVYQGLDYSGVTSTQKFYIQVK